MGRPFVAECHTSLFQNSYLFFNRTWFFMAHKIGKKMTRQQILRYAKRVLL